MWLSVQRQIAKEFLDPARVKRVQLAAIKTGTKSPKEL
jgi:hypothetical protein